MAAVVMPSSSASFLAEPAFSIACSFVIFAY
jgi:hypothetical protein